MEGYIYIEDSKVVWNPEKKPESLDFVKYCPHKKYCYVPKFKEALKQWQSECVKVDNFHEYWSHSKKHYILPHLHTCLTEIVPGQKATIESKTITKLLWKK